MADEDLPEWVTEISEYNNRAGTTRKSMNIWAYFWTKDYTGEEILFPDGYDQILTKFSGDYDLSLNETVSEVEYKTKGIRVVTNRATREFDTLIVTVPLGVLKSGDISFKPELPKKTQRAIDRLGYGTLDKIYLQFDRVFWDEKPHNIITPFTDFPPGYYNSWVNLYAITGKPVILGFNGGPAALALSSETDETVVGNALQTLLKAYGIVD